MEKLKMQSFDVIGSYRQDSAALSAVRDGAQRQ